MANTNFNNIDKYSEKVFVKSSKGGVQPFDLETYHLIDSEAVYTICYKIKSIGMERGIEKMLGYKLSDFNFDNLHELIHPEDREMVCHIVMSAIKNAADLGIDFSDRLRLWFRMKHANGEYLRVERTSGVYEFSRDGGLISTFSLLKKDPLTPVDNAVRYQWQSNYMSPSEFHKYIDGKNLSIFTKRELEILKFLASGYSYKYISKRLFICSETIRSHKKNMKRKLGTTNSNDLIVFYHNHLKGHV